MRLERDEDLAINDIDPQGLTSLYCRHPKWLMIVVEEVPGLFKKTFDLDSFLKKKV